MICGNPTVWLRRGLAALDADRLRTAKRLFAKVARQEPSPVALSCLGYCLARQDHDLERAFALCREALAQEPANPLHHLNLGRVHLLAGDKAAAVDAFRAGLSFGRDPRLIAEIERLGMRRPLLFPALDRRHPLNLACGFFLSRLGLRAFFHPPEQFRAHHR